MIQQAAKGLNSRSEANPFNEDGFLPLITAPMYSVVDENNYQTFLDNKIQVCLPRKIELSGESIIKYGSNAPIWFSLSLQEFIDYWCDTESPAVKFPSKYKVCIDTANGNMPALHDAVRKAKEIHGDNLIIMAGNVGSVEAFVELAKPGVDYIRVGIGGGGGCNTTSNTGVGNPFNLGYLITQCDFVRKDYITAIKSDNGFRRTEGWQNIAKVKIVADGISSWIKFCEEEYGYNDNGYAAINELLFAGADLVMVGKLFAQCVESAGTKRLGSNNEFDWQDGDYEDRVIDGWIHERYYREKLEVKYSGMSTHQEQGKYKEPLLVYVTSKSENGELFINRDWLKKGDFIWYGSKKVELTSNPESISKTEFRYTTKNFPLTLSPGDTFIIKQHKPSEGSVQWIPVRWTLSEWLNGSPNQDEAPYLMGWINSIKSAMAYTGKTTL